MFNYLNISVKMFQFSKNRKALNDLQGYINCQSRLPFLFLKIIVIFSEVSSDFSVSV